MLRERPRYTLNLPKNRRMELGPRTLVMGILNVTPDSFSDGGLFLDPDKAVRHAREMIEAGADILDIGGESTRPFSDPVPLEEELRRTIPVIRAIREFTDIPISIDTTKAEVARQALDAGADIINDVSALRFDPEMAEVAAERNVPVILMHMLGTPKTMQENPTYRSVVSEIIAFLDSRIEYAISKGIKFENIIVDPGIGFGKTVNHNLQIIRNLDAFHSLERPILLGASRKRFIGAILGTPPEDRETGLAAVNTYAITSGVHILRVHDVRFHLQVVRMTESIMMGYADSDK
ncbi:dihydropteroate synthase [Thermodesulforhabdus norvegica]|uniref:Dihydropteroate synthase n=1 Tax=Thermodesulforhabdus norvegica TaxID=39841 RepID=A0A1I4QW43_9BACT|nr:dihydropteroate synthase [Thermodesulforhabdus norvegica]SFM44278.1 Dihydropteroate synthase [Thermodesulforhabdus norvegica]